MSTMAPEQISNTGTSLDESSSLRSDTGDGPVTHIVWIPEDKMKMSAAAYVMAARIEGLMIRALCGYEWVPSRDPKQHPVCGKCRDIWERSGSQGNLGEPEGLDS